MFNFENYLDQTAINCMLLCTEFQPTYWLNGQPFINQEFAGTISNTSTILNWISSQPRWSRDMAEVDGLFQDVKILSTSLPGGTSKWGSRV